MIYYGEHTIDARRRQRGALARDFNSYGYLSLLVFFVRADGPSHPLGAEGQPVTAHCE